MLKRIFFEIFVFVILAIHNNVSCELCKYQKNSLNYDLTKLKENK